MREKLRTRWEQSALKAWADGKLPLSRGKKLVLNLVIVALAGLWLWGLADYPLPTAELEFRRLERASLEERSELVLALDRERDVQARDGTGFSFTRPMVVGRRGDRVLVGYSNRFDDPFDMLRRYEWEDGPAPVPLYPNMVSWVDTAQNGATGDRDHIFESPLLLVGVPREAVTGTLELTVLDLEGRSYPQECPVFELGEGIWLTSVKAPWDVYSSNWCEGGTYTLRLYDQAGDLLLEQEGTVPEPI